MKKVAQLKISLKDSEPLIWRRVLVPVDVTFRKLHEILNAVMGWEAEHLWVFRVGKDEIGDVQWESGEWINDKQIKLKDIVGAKKKFIYEYDFGDGWEHEIVIEKLVEADPREKYPICIDGENACPPEDCGGLYGYENFKEAMANPDHPDHELMTEWWGPTFDPTKFDPALLNKRVLQRKHLASPRTSRTR